MTRTHRPSDAVGRRLDAILAAGLVATILVLPGCTRSSPAQAVAEDSSAADQQPQVPSTGADEASKCCTQEAQVATTDGPQPDLTTAPARVIPDVSLTDQDGKLVRFFSDLVKGRVVAVNFIFTSCKGVCPPLGANFAALSRRLGPKLGKDMGLISISVDPTFDTPERLKEWSAGFHPSLGWTLVTGSKSEVDRLLKALGVFAADKTNHSPFLLMTDSGSGPWLRLHGLTSPVTVAERMESMLAARDKPAGERASVTIDQGDRFDNPRARQYFTDVRLVDQGGRELRLYEDLMRGKVVVIQSFFCSCRGACPTLVSNMSKVQERFGDRLGGDLRLLSMTVDPLNDTPERMKDYADRLKARPGWYFLTGTKSDVEFALGRLGLGVETKEQHTNLFLVGNDRTGLWKKALGTARLEDLLGVIESVLDDQADPDPAEGAN
jgi:cytochrome oxidase Cu insertion factor (SCO1/SenC/PrrC family)